MSDGDTNADVNMPQPPTNDVSTSSNGQDVAALMNELQRVDTNAPDASLNETTISDNNGGRINLNEKPTFEKRDL